MTPVTQINPCLSGFIKEFLGKALNLKISDCSGSTNSPSIISAPSAHSMLVTVGCGHTNIWFRRKKKICQEIYPDYDV